MHIFASIKCKVHHKIYAGEHQNILYMYMSSRDEIKSGGEKSGLKFNQEWIKIISGLDLN